MGGCCGGQRAAMAADKRISQLRIAFVDDNAVGEDDASRAYLFDLRKDFDHADKDKNGFLDADELRDLLKKLYTPSKEEIEAFVTFFDTNSDGKISQAEFLQGFDKLNDDASRKDERAERARALFAKYDSNPADGFLSGEELVQIAKETLHVPDETVEAVMAEFDTKKDRKVSFAEFVRASVKIEGGLAAVWEFAHIPSTRNRAIVNASLMRQAAGKTA